MKKLITLLITVSIMLTSCGKSSGLSNSGKKDDNKTPATNTSTSNQLQKIDNDNIKQLLTDYAKDHKKAIIFIVAVIVVGSFFVVKFNERKLKPLPEIPEGFRPALDSVSFFAKKLEKSGESYLKSLWGSLRDIDLVCIYFLDSTFADWRPLIKNELAKRNYDVSALKK
ncbi:MAG: hypothetical protein LBN01_01215 [Endomicrobium sp.]|nr:hypothetical protein [Endomicrobium sp.]